MSPWYPLSIPWYHHFPWWHFDVSWFSPISGKVCWEVSTYFYVGGAASARIGDGSLSGDTWLAWLHHVPTWSIFEAVVGFEAAQIYTLYQDYVLLLLLHLLGARFRSQRTKNMTEFLQPRLLFCTIIVTAKKSAKGCCRANIRVWEHVLRAVATSSGQLKQLWRNRVIGNLYHGQATDLLPISSEPPESRWNISKIQGIQ